MFIRLSDIHPFTSPLVTLPIIIILSLLCYIYLSHYHSLHLCHSPTHSLCLSLSLSAALSLSHTQMCDWSRVEEILRESGLSRGMNLEAAMADQYDVVAYREIQVSECVAM